MVELVANRKSELVLVRLKSAVEFANRKMDHLFMQLPPDMLEHKLEQVRTFWRGVSLGLGLGVLGILSFISIQKYQFKSIE